MELTIFFIIGIMLNIMLRNTTMILTEYAFVISSKEKKQLSPLKSLKKISRFQKICNYYLTMLLPYINVILFFIYWNIFFKTEGSLFQKIYASIVGTKKYSCCLC